jgi:hypothetical protein
MGHLCANRHAHATGRSSSPPARLIGFRTRCGAGGTQSDVCAPADAPGLLSGSSPVSLEPDHHGSSRMRADHADRL